MTARRASRPEPAAKVPKGLTIRYELLDELIPNARNAYVHSAIDIAEKEASLMEFGWTLPLAKADGGLLCGHARRQAAINLRHNGKHIPRNPDPDRAPCVDLSHLKPAQRRAYAIADNKMARRGSFDRDILAMELTDLRADGFDLQLAGFDAPDLASLLGDGTLSIADPEPETPGACPKCGRIFVL